MPSEPAERSEPLETSLIVAPRASRKRRAAATVAVHDLAQLNRLERKLDRQSRLLWGLLLFQPLVIASSLLPDATAEWLTLLFLVLFGVLLIFPRLEKQFPKIMRGSGRRFGSLRRWLRRRER